MRGDTSHRYEEVAHFITTLVDSGTLALGARAPSLRAICRQRRISLSTALQAYRLLEDRGLLEARPQSGYYVVRGADGTFETPAITRPPVKPNPVAVSGLIVNLLEYANNRALLPLGCAIPSPDLLAAERLDRCLARAARVRGRDCNTYSEPRGDAGLRREIARRAMHW